MKRAFNKIRRKLFPWAKDIIEDYLEDNKRLIQNIESFQSEIKLLMK